MKDTRIAAVALTGLAAMMGGCVADGAEAPLGLSSPPSFTAEASIPAPLAPSPVNGISMPWQLTPASTASVAQGEKTIVVPDRRYGQVKGTPIAVANLDKPVVAYARNGRETRACKTTIAQQAKGIGAYSVQAAPAGPERLVGGGRRRQQIFFRIIYDRPGLLEVRQAALLCTIDAANRVVAADPV